jgi:hypothetical protein
VKPTLAADKSPRVLQIKMTGPQDSTAMSIHRLSPTIECLESRWSLVGIIQVSGHDGELFSSVLVDGQFYGRVHCDNSGTMYTGFLDRAFYIPVIASQI